MFPHDHKKSVKSFPKVTRFNINVKKSNVFVEVVVVEGEENCSAVHTAVDSKETMVLDVAVVVVVETGSCSEVVDSKLVQIR